MQYFWATVVSLVLVMILYSIISSNIKNRKMRKVAGAMMPKLQDHIQADHRYNIFLSHGKSLVNVKFLGLATPYEDKNSPFLPFPLQQWLIVEKENGKKAYIKPESVRYYEDAEEQT
jgi:hypothetical protein